MTATSPGLYLDDSRCISKAALTKAQADRLTVYLRQIRIQSDERPGTSHSP
jgi:hypothetical protein